MAGASFAGYVKVDGVDGNSTDKAHPKWIEILGFRHGISQATSARSLSGHGATERADVGDFSVLKALDKTSPKLYLKCAKGERIPTVTVELARASGDSLTYMKWVLKDVIISSVTPSGASSEVEHERFPTEEVTFNFGEIEWEYTPVKADGTKDAAIKAGWSCIENAEK